MVVTGIIQSSSAVVGIIQTIASSVGVTFCGVFAVIIGVNIGDCLTTFLVSRIGASPKQVRVAMIHVIYNVFAAALLSLVIACGRAFGLIGDNIWNMTLDSGGVANVHGMFRLIPAVVLLPFSGLFAKISEELVKDVPLDEEDILIEENLKELDPRLVTNPTLALSQTAHLISHMAEVAVHNYHACVDQIFKYDEKRTTRINQREDLLDRMADASNQYIVDVSPHVILERDSQIQGFQIRALTCFERIGDYAINITKDIENMREREETFTDTAMKDLKVMSDAVEKILKETRTAFKRNDPEAAREIEPLEEVIDELVDALKARHVRRVTDNVCGVYSSILFENILQNLERVSDQCSDLAVYILGLSNPEIAGKEHEYIHFVHHANDARYMEVFRINHEKYFGKLV